MIRIKLICPKKKKNVRQLAFACLVVRHHTVPIICISIQVACLILTIKPYDMTHLFCRLKIMWYVTHVFSCLKIMWYVTHVFSCFKVMWYVTHVFSCFKVMWYVTHVFRSFKDGKQKNLLELKTTVIYKRNPEKVTILDDTVSLDVIKNKNFTVTIRTQYSVTVVRDTDCAQMEKKVNGTMIGLYEFNPNAENKAALSWGSIINALIFFGLPFFLFILWWCKVRCKDYIRELN